MAHPRRPNRLQTDKRSEFLNEVQTFLKDKAIHHYSSETDHKASMLERFNKSLKSLMYRYFTANNTYQYVDVLDDLVNAYNHAKHRSIVMAPSDVKSKYELQIWQRMYPKQKQLPKKQLKLDVTVRLSKRKQTFGKRYMPKWTEELFKLSSIPTESRRRV